MDSNSRMAANRASAWYPLFIVGVVGAAAAFCSTGSKGATACREMASVSASPASISLGQSTTVSWNIQGSADECEPSMLRLNFRDATTGVSIDTGVTVHSVQPAGYAVVQPPSSGNYFLHVRLNNSRQVDLGSAAVSVALPVVNNRTTVDITQPNQNGLFAQAIRVDNAVVRIAGTLDLDLSFMTNLTVGSGVQILGDRTTVRAGPRLFTTTFPRILLNIGPSSDHVRISGIRLDGGESDDPFSAVGKDDADGISVSSSQDVEIDHNEIYRWRGAAVNVHDGNDANNPASVGRINLDNADTVRVHDNYIHHNQHPSSNFCGSGAIDGGGHAAGYGVVVSDGAYALIERNVFDWNRHSIAGDGKTGTGYLAFRNLILTNGGVHFRCLDNSNLEGIALLLNPFATVQYIIAEALDGGAIYHTHTIDMHAVNNCYNGVFTGDPNFGDHNCGPAGEFMDIEFNTVLYTAGNGVHLRGTPKIGMDVKHNVFAHKNHDGGFLTPGAMLQNETGLHDSDNILGLNTFNDRKSCDFDGDGISDPFIATGVTFWFSSSVLGGRWVFLAQSPASIDEVSFGDFDGDGRCDVSALGQTFLNPDPLPFAQSPGSVSTVVGTPATLNLSATGGSRPYTWVVTGLPPGLSANTAGQISGTPTTGAAPSYPVTATAKDTNQQMGSVTFTWSVTARVPALVGEQPSAAESLVTSAGLTVGRVSYNNTCIDPGSVVAQAPSSGATVPVGSGVEITVSTCPSGGGSAGGGPILPK